MATENGHHPAPAQPPESRLDPDVHATLCELYARVLVLDAEWRRLGEWLNEMRRVECPPPSSVRSRRYLELSEELRALRARIAEIRARVDPEGKML